MQFLIRARDTASAAQLPGAIAALNRGERLAFGDLQISTAGIQAAKGFLAWPSGLRPGRRLTEDISADSALENGHVVPGAACASSVPLPPARRYLRAAPQSSSLFVGIELPPHAARWRYGLRPLPSRFR
jgi:hypothetical protein